MCWHVLPLTARQRNSASACSLLEALSCAKPGVLSHTSALVSARGGGSFAYCRLVTPPWKNVRGRWHENCHEVKESR